MEIRQGTQRSDHLVVTVPPSSPAKPRPKYVSFRNTRDHRKIAMETKLSTFDWNSINNLDNPEESVKLLNAILWSIFNESFLQSIFQGPALHVRPGKASLQN